MVRRTVLIATLLATVSAAGALAAASELAPGKWGFLRGFTPASALVSVHGSAVVFPQLESDSAKGEFCPLPSIRDSLGVLAIDPSATDSSSGLFLEGLSRAPGAAADSVCTGDTASLIRLPVKN